MRTTLRLRVGTAAAHAELVRGRRVLWTGEARFATPQELEEAVSQLATQETLPARPAVLQVELEPPLAQIRTLRGLPPVRGTQLRALVATGTSRYFRRNGKPLVTDACWMDRAARRQGIALAAAAEEPWLMAVIDGARIAGLPVETLRPVALPAGARLDLMPPAERRRRRERAVLSIRRLGTAAAIAWLVAGGAFVLRLERERAAVDRQIAALERPARAVSEARRAMGEAARMVEIIERAATERGRVVAGLTGLGAALPDSSFATGLVLGADGAGRIFVTARRSADVLAALDRAGAFVSPRLDGTVVRERLGASDWERFTVTFGPGRPK
jgi:hypothetical protein